MGEGENEVVEKKEAEFRVYLTSPRGVENTFSAVSEREKAKLYPVSSVYSIFL